MNVSMNAENLRGVKEALGIANLRRAMNQDAQSVAMVIDAMEEATAKAMELSVTPYKGANIDISA